MLLAHFDFPLFSPFYIPFTHQRLSLYCLFDSLKPPRDLFLKMSEQAAFESIPAFQRMMREDTGLEVSSPLPSPPFFPSKQHH